MQALYCGGPSLCTHVFAGQYYIMDHIYNHIRNNQNKVSRINVYSLLLILMHARGKGFQTQPTVEPQQPTQFPGFEKLQPHPVLRHQTKAMRASFKTTNTFQPANQTTVKHCANCTFLHHGCDFVSQLAPPLLAHPSIPSRTSF